MSIFDLDIEVEYYECDREADNSNPVTLSASHERIVERGNSYTCIFRHSI